MQCCGMKLLNKKIYKAKNNMIGECGDCLIHAVRIKLSSYLVMQLFALLENCFRRFQIKEIK